MIYIFHFLLELGCKLTETYSVCQKQKRRWELHSKLWLEKCPDLKTCRKILNFGAENETIRAMLGLTYYKRYLTY